MILQPHTSYVVCGTPRCGSTLLCEALINTGIAGQPEEYFLPRNEPIWQGRWGTSSYEQYLAAVFKQSTTTNGVFGTKMMWGYFDKFVSKLQQLPEHNERRKSAHELMMSTFPNLHYIWIKRRDKVRQAISHAKARQTDIWVVSSKSKPLLARKPVFSFGQIDFMTQELKAQEVAWERYFLENGIEPFEVIYEDLVPKYEEVAIQLLEYLDIAHEAVQFAPRRMRKQADEESEEWAERYHSLKTRSLSHRLHSSMNRLIVTFLHTTRAGTFLLRERAY